MFATVIGLLGKAIANPVLTIIFLECSNPSRTGRKGSLFSSPETSASYPRDSACLTISIVFLDKPGI